MSAVPLPVIAALTKGKTAAASAGVRNVVVPAGAQR